MNRRHFIGSVAAFFAAMQLPSWLRRKPKPTYLFNKDALFVNNLNAGQPAELRSYQVGEWADYWNFISAHRRPKRERSESMPLSREQLIERLKAKGHEPTEHNITCEEFAVAFEEAGHSDCVEDICYEGSGPWLDAALQDGKDPYAASERKSREEQERHVN